MGFHASHVRENWTHKFLRIPFAELGFVPIYLKNVINSSVSMTQCVEALVASDRWTEKEYKNEMANVMRFTTYCVAEQMEPQYAATLSKSENYKYEVSTDDPDELYASSMPSYNCVPSALTFLCACYSMVLH
ncbi:hypothetical protein PC114_g18483 [Phytophthora cactorum]|nr:hypothetical protein PC114_g18483 [Phytophthora cactorum]